MFSFSSCPVIEREHGSTAHNRRIDHYCRASRAGPGRREPGTLGGRSPRPPNVRQLGGASERVEGPVHGVGSSSQGGVAAVGSDVMGNRGSHGR